MISYISIIQHPLHGFVEYCITNMNQFSNAGTLSPYKVYIKYTLYMEIMYNKFC